MGNIGRSRPAVVEAADRRWLLDQALFLLIAGMGFLYLFETTDLDRQLAHLFFDEAGGIFPIRKSELFELIFHKWAKQLSYVAALVMLVVCWKGWKGQLSWLPPRNALLAALGMVLIPICTTLLKMATGRYCPWDMLEFGGYAPYLRLLETAPTGIKTGQCFPAGHASAGFLWVVWGVALCPAGIKAARWGIFTGLSLGALLGLSRMAQGAHFLSHTLATLWLAWALSLLLAWMLKAELGFVREDADTWLSRCTLKGDAPS